MAQQEAISSSKFVRLRDEFRNNFLWRHQKLNRDEFREWARKTRAVPVRFSRHQYRPMHDGLPVPREMVEAFGEYISDVIHITSPKDSYLSVIAEPCDPPAASAAKKSTRLPDVTVAGWTRSYAEILAQLGLDDAAFCTGESDLRFAAHLVCECLGWHDKRLTGASALAYAESVMKRSVADYARFLQMLWRANEHCVLFATQRDGKEVVRIGVTVCFPLSSQFYQRFRAGEADEFEITPEHVPPQSQYVLAQAMAENVAIDLKRNLAVRSLAQLRHFLYQFAALFSPVFTFDPHIVTFAGSKENAKRLRAYNFTSTGANLALNGKEIVEFAPPHLKTHGIAYIPNYTEYVTMRSAIHLFQEHIESQRLPPD